MAARIGWLAYLLLAAAACLIWYQVVWSNGIIGIFDWRKDEFFLAYLISSIREQGTIPTAFFALPEHFDYPTLMVTRLYFANPEVISYSPFLGLARYLSSEPFFLALFGIHLGVAAIGIYKLGGYFHFPFFIRLCAFVLIVLNPWLMQHLAIGYVPWFNALLVPLTVWLLLIARDHVLAIGAAALCSALMIYQGGFHVWLWINMAIAVVTFTLSLLTWSRGPLLRTLSFWLLAVLAAAPRLLATQRAFNGYPRAASESYASASDVLGLLLDTQTNPYQLPQAYSTYGTNFYDGSLVMGSAWLVVLAGACALAGWRAWRAPQADRLPAALLISAMLFVMFGWHGLWKHLVAMLPFLSAEIYPWRFLFVAVTLLSFFILRELALLHSHHGRTAKLVALLACFAMIPSNYARNQAFSSIASSGESHYANFSMSQFLRAQLPVIEQVTQRWIAPSIVFDRIVYPPSHYGYRIPWMTKSQLASFAITGTTLQFETADGQAVTTASDAPMVVAARQIVTEREVLTSFALFLLAQAGIALAYKRRFV